MSDFISLTFAMFFALPLFLLAVATGRKKKGGGSGGGGGASGKGSTGSAKGRRRLRRVELRFEKGRPRT